jgi:hypothetical protein
MFFTTIHKNLYDFGGFYNAPNYVNDQTFAILKADGSITTWGGLIYGTVAPTGKLNKS